MNLFIYYPKCSTCKKTKKWLDEKGILYEERDIVKDRPREEELKRWIQQSGYPIKKFFNTSGNRYKELELKDKLQNMSEEEQIALLATDGMLVKRPLLIAEDVILVGFKTEQWEEVCEKIRI